MLHELILFYGALRCVRLLPCLNYLQVAGLRITVTATATPASKEDNETAALTARSARSPRSQPPPLLPGRGVFPLGSIDSGSSIDRGHDPSVVLGSDQGSSKAAAGAGALLEGPSALAVGGSSSPPEPRVSASVPRLDSSSSPMMTSSNSPLTSSNFPTTSSSSSPPSLALPPSLQLSSSLPPMRPTVSGPRPPPPQPSPRTSPTHGPASTPSPPPPLLPSPASTAALLRGESEPRSPSSRGTGPSSALQPPTASSSSKLPGSPERVNRSGGSSGSGSGNGSGLVLKAPPPRGARGARQESKAQRPPPPPLTPAAVPPPPPFKVLPPLLLSLSSSHCTSFSVLMPIISFHYLSFPFQSLSWCL
jgi:hypothetical protein